MDQVYDVGGVLLPRPFQIRRVSHIGLNCADGPAMLRCYRDHLGLRLTDVSENLANKMDPHGRDLTADGARTMHFLRYGGDHHQLVLMHQDLWSRLDTEHPDLTVNQISWQVGDLAEVAAAIDWLGGEDQRILRSGRDMPGSNWHTYVLDPDGYTNELTFGMEQVGWNGHSKPQTLWDTLRFGTFPDTPHISEYAELEQAKGLDIDLAAGFRPEPEDEENGYDVGGVRLARPFKVVSHGPFSLVVSDLERSLAYYRDLLGLAVRTRGSHDGVDFALLYCNTAHHALGLYADSVRPLVGLPQESSLFSVGFQVANHRQLREAAAYLIGLGHTEVAVPERLVPGFGHVTHLRDPDGGLIQLYAYMRQCPPGEDKAVVASDTGPAAGWPETIAAPADAFHGEVFMGPWA